MTYTKVVSYTEHPELSLNEYQSQARLTAQYPDKGHNLIYPALKLNGEAGEVAEKIGKAWRNQGITDAANLSPVQKEALIAEIGDCAWYLAALCSELQVDFESVARYNLQKLADRAKRGVIKSQGDTR